MNLLVFGGSGPTGKYLIKQALDLGHKLTVIARSPDVLKAEFEHENLNIVKGDATNGDTFDEHMAGKDAVVSCLGAHAYRWKHVTVYSEFATAVETSMEKHDVKRMIAMSSWGVRDSPQLSFLVRWVFLPLFIRNVLDDLLRMEESFMKSSMDYTVVKAAGLKNGDHTDSEIKVAVNDECVEGCLNSIMRSDVSHFMLKCLQSEKYSRTALSIGVEEIKPC